MLGEMGRNVFRQSSRTAAIRCLMTNARLAGLELSNSLWQACAATRWMRWLKQFGALRSVTDVVTNLSGRLEGEDLLTCLVSTPS